MPDIYPSPNCTSAEGRQTIQHILIDCPNLQAQRAALFDRIDIGNVISDTAYKDCIFNTNVLLGQNSHLSKEMRNIIIPSVVIFICQTNIDI